MPALVLAHSPLTGPAAWGLLPAVLRGLGRQVVVLDVRDDDRPPFAARYVARAALQVRDETDGPAVLVGHSGAGYLLPQLGAARAAARSPVRGYVFLDAGIPHGRSATRLSLLRGEDPAAAEELEVLLAAGGRYPTWADEDLRALVPDDGLRADLVASLRPRGLGFFAEPLPYPGADTHGWPDAPCGYLQTSPAYDGPARQAGSRGWPVVSRGGGHFAACAEPAGLAHDLLALLDRL